MILEAFSLLLPASALRVIFCPRVWAVWLPLLSDFSTAHSGDFSTLRAFDWGCFWAMLIVLSLLRRFFTATGVILSTRQTRTTGNIRGPESEAPEE